MPVVKPGGLIFFLALACRVPDCCFQVWVIVWPDCCSVQWPLRPGACFAVCSDHQDQGRYGTSGSVSSTCTGSCVSMIVSVKDHLVTVRGLLLSKWQFERHPDSVVCCVSGCVTSPCPPVGLVIIVPRVLVLLRLALLAALQAAPQKSRARAAATVLQVVAVDGSSDAVARHLLPNGVLCCKSVSRFQPIAYGQPDHHGLCL